MAITQITLDSITNATTADDGTGYFDKLMRTMELHIEDQYNKGRLKGPEYATVYLGGMQAILQAAQEFTLTKQLQEVQVDNAIKDGYLKDAQLGTEGLQQDMLNKQLVEEQYKIDVLLPDQHTTNTKQQTLLDTEEEIKQYEHDVLQLDNHNQNAAQLAEILDGTIRANIQLDDTLLTTEKQRLDIVEGTALKTTQILDVEQATKLKTAQTSEQTADTIRKDKITEDQLLKIQAETDSINTDDTVKSEQWYIQKDIMAKQLNMITIDAANKQSIVDKDLALKQAQVDQAVADTDFTIDKTQTMKDTREDNVRMQAAREYGEYLKYISAAGVVPSSYDFDNLVGLIDSMVNKAPGDIVTKSEILQSEDVANGAGYKFIQSTDSYGPFIVDETYVSAGDPESDSANPTHEYKSYFYRSTIAGTDWVCFRVGNVTCTTTESNGANTKCDA